MASMTPAAASAYAVTAGFTAAKAKTHAAILAMDVTNGPGGVLGSLDRLLLGGPHDPLAGDLHAVPQHPAHVTDRHQQRVPGPDDAGDLARRPGAERSAASWA